MKAMDAPIWCRVAPTELSAELPDVLLRSRLSRDLGSFINCEGGCRASTRVRPSQARRVEAVRVLAI